MRVFISYSRKDRAKVDKLVRRLKRQCPRDSIWYDQNLHVGDKWWDNILFEIQRCNVFLFLLSEESLSSDYCAKELDRAILWNKMIMPVRIREVTKPFQDLMHPALADNLRSRQEIDLRKNTHANWDSLVAAMNLAREESLNQGSDEAEHSEDAIELTRLDRWTLSNQFGILAALFPNQRDAYEEFQEIVERGYELDYRDISQYIFPEKYTMSREACLEVIDILDMYAGLRASYDALDDKSGIELNLLEFRGFDGNYETTYMAYARFLVRRQGKFDWLFENKKTDFNSHFQMLDRYRRMLSVAREMSDLYTLSRENILRIIGA